MATFESMDRRMPKIEACLKANGLESLDACNEMLLAKGIDCDKIVRGVQPICFDNAVWAYTLGTAIAVKRGLTDAAECAAAIGEGLEAFTIPGSVAEQRQVGLGHGPHGALRREELSGGDRRRMPLPGCQQQRDRKSTRLNSSHITRSRMPSSA